LEEEAQAANLELEAVGKREAVHGLNFWAVLAAVAGSLLCVWVRAIWRHYGLESLDRSKLEEATENVPLLM